MIPIDGDPIRKKARKDYEKARRDLDKARLQLDQFHTQDRPAFDRWLNANFFSPLPDGGEIYRLGATTFVAFACVLKTVA